MNPFQNLSKLGLGANHVLHIGGHQGQEVEFYKESGVEKITLVEPIPELAQQLRSKFDGVQVLEYAIGLEEGPKEFHVMNPTNVSTLLEPLSEDRVSRKITVEVKTLENITEPDMNLLVVDTQGTELEVLESGKNVLSQFEGVIVETCTVQDKTMASLYDDVVDFMRSQGFHSRVFWPRDYTGVVRFARGPKAEARPGEQIRDVVFTR